METNLFITYCLGVVIGSIITIIYQKLSKPEFGTLKIDEKKSIFMIELKDTQKVMTRKKWVTLRIKKGCNLVSMSDSSEDTQNKQSL